MHSGWPIDFETTAVPYSAATIGVMLDEALGTSINLVRPADSHTVTSELAIDFVRIGDESVRSLHCTGRVLARLPDCALGGGEVRDQDGEIVAAGTTWCRFGPGSVELGVAPIPPADLRLDQLLEFGEGASQLRPNSECANELGTLHGGIALAAAHDVGLHRLAGIIAQPKATSVRVNYLRPGPVDQPVSYESIITHAGRTVAVVSVRGVNQTGKIITVATVTARA